MFSRGVASRVSAIGIRVTYNCVKWRATIASFAYCIAWNCVNYLKTVKQLEFYRKGVVGVF